MMDFVLLVAAFVLGNLLTAVAGLLVFCNKKVMKKYTKWAMKMTNEIADELFEDSNN